MNKKQRAALAKRAFNNRGLPQDRCAREIGIGYTTFRNILKGEEHFKKKPELYIKVNDWITEWAGKE